MAQFHIVALEELPPGGDVVKEVPDGEITADGAAHFPGSQMLRPGYGDLHAHFLVGRTGAKGDFGHRCYGSQRLSPEAEGEDVMQVFGR